MLLDVGEKAFEMPALYEPEVVNVINHFVRPGDCVIDVGASIGFFTVHMSRIVGEGGLVLAFEPHLESYRYLCRNVHEIYKLNNVACLRTAAWKYDVPELTLFSMPWPGYSSMHDFDETYYPETVEGRSLDTWLAGKNHPRFIKIDVEGCEMEVLLGAQQMLKRGVDCVVLEFNFKILKDIGRLERDLREHMARLGYDCFLINITDDKDGYADPIKVALDKQLKIIMGPDGTHHINVMFSTEEKVKERWADHDRGQEIHDAAGNNRQGAGNGSG
jgi:FkbM family methyltransferase